MIAMVRAMIGMLIGFGVAASLLVLAAGSADALVGSSGASRFVLGAVLGPFAAGVGIVLGGVVGGLPALAAVGLGIAAAGFAATAVWLIAGSSAAMAAGIGTGFMVGVVVVYVSNSHVRSPSVIVPPATAAAWAALVAGFGAGLAAMMRSSLTASVIAAVVAGAVAGAVIWHWTRDLQGILLHRRG